MRKSFLTLRLLSKRTLFFKLTSLRMKMRIVLLLCTFFVLNGLFQKANAQNFQVTGRVISRLNEPLAGATVTVKGSTVSTITDVQGNFSINVPNGNAILVVTYLGYDPQELAAKNAGPLLFTLSENARNLDELVVIGHGTQ